MNFLNSPSLISFQNVNTIKIGAKEVYIIFQIYLTTQSKGVLTGFLL